MNTPDIEVWEPLRQELEHWYQNRQVATLWWRDDDSTTSTPALSKLKTISTRHNIPIALSVIPAYANQTLSTVLSLWPKAYSLQHGYDHINYALKNERKSEFCRQRSVEDMCLSLRKGFERLQTLLGRQNLAVLVPPWNRLSETLIPFLPKLGYIGLSRYQSKTRFTPQHNLVQINTHIDVIDWRTRTFIGTAAVIKRLVELLQVRRNSMIDTKNTKPPIGILTHHALHEEKIWRFLEQFFSFTSHHPCVTWSDSQTLFSRSYLAKEHHDLNTSILTSSLPSIPPLE